MQSRGHAAARSDPLGGGPGDAECGCAEHSTAAPPTGRAWWTKREPVVRMVKDVVLLAFAHTPRNTLRSVDLRFGAPGATSRMGSARRFTACVPAMPWRYWPRSRTRPRPNEADDEAQISSGLPNLYRWVSAGRILESSISPSESLLCIISCPGCIPARSCSPSPLFATSSASWVKPLHPPSLAAKLVSPERALEPSATEDVDDAAPTALPPCRRTTSSDMLKGRTEKLVRDDGVPVGLGHPSNVMSRVMPALLMRISAGPTWDWTFVIVCWQESKSATSTGKAKKL